MLKRFAAAAMLAAFALLSPGHASEAGDIARKHLYEGTLAAGLEELTPLQDALHQDAWFGMGLLTFVQGVEHLAQSFHRYGLAAPETGPMGPPLLLPVPANPHPEPLDYQTFRGILETLVSDMDRARALLEDAGRQGDYVVPLDLLKFRIDINGDGKTEDAESIGTVLTRAIGEDPAVFAPPPAPEVTAPPAPAPDRKGPGDKASKGPAAPEAPIEPPAPVEAEVPAIPEAIIGFDRADAIWLAGYSQVLAAQADFLLAHDFETTFNATFHRLFPRSNLPMQEFSNGGMLMLDPASDNAIADFVAAIHTINWPVVEPERLKRVLTRFQAITSLSRQNWQAILAETDDNAELIPNPRQTSLVPEGQVTDEIIAAWMATLDTVDKILAGELLVPHWRFARGFDLKAWFETSTRTDFVMLLTGYDALPFLKDGPVATAESFAAGNRVFGDNFLGYAFWFN